MTSAGKKKPKAPDVFLDNASTTAVPPPVVDAVAGWLNRGSPSAESAPGRAARKMMDAFRRTVAAECGFELEGPRGFQVVFTSGASEGNCHVVTAAARAYAAKTGKLPHVVASAVEHASLLLCCRQLARDGLAQLTLLPVQKGGDGAGTVDPGELEKALRPNTCLVAVMAANNETGAINDLRALGEVAHGARVPFYSDAAQLFGKSPVRPRDLNLDAFSASFHKLHGPPGVGLLALRNDFVAGYGLGAHVCGPQNAGLRGGGENLPGIAGAFVAFRLAVRDRGAKNARVRALRDGVQKALAEKFLALHLDDYREARPRVPGEDAQAPRPARAPGAPRTERGAAALAGRLAAAAEAGAPVLVWIGPRGRARVLPNILFFAVARTGFCNLRARAFLGGRGVVVGVGPACNAAEAGASHVVEAMDVPPELRPGVLRVSFSDETTRDEAAAFLRHFCAAATSDETLAS